MKIGMSEEDQRKSRIQPGDIVKLDLEKATEKEKGKFGEGKMTVIREDGPNSLVVLTNNSPEPKGSNKVRGGPIQRDKLKNI